MRSPVRNLLQHCRSKRANSGLGWLLVMVQSCWIYNVFWRQSQLDLFIDWTWYLGESGIRIDSKVFGLSHWVNDSIFFSDGKNRGRTDLLFFNWWGGIGECSQNQLLNLNLRWPLNIWGTYWTNIKYKSGIPEERYLFEKLPGKEEARGLSLVLLHLEGERIMYIYQQRFKGSARWDKSPEPVIFLRPSEWKKNRMINLLSAAKWLVKM